MPVIDRTLWFTSLVDDDGSGTVGTVWQKSEIGKFIDSIDAILQTGQYQPANHAGRHTSGSADPIALDTLAAPTDITTLNATTTTHGLLPKLTGTATVFLRGDGAWASAVTLHAATHKAGGGDAIRLDELAAPTDVTTLDASTAAHGLLPKLPGGTTAFLRGDGIYAIPTGTVPSAHAATHGSGGTDPITVAESQVTNLITDLGAINTNKADKTDPRFTDARTPTAHAASHKAAGGDPIKLDELGAPTDVTTLNASTFSHGLLPKLPGGSTTFLRGDGTFAAPTSTPGAHAATHASAGSDPVDVTGLAGFPGNTTAFLRADGQFVIPPNGSAGGGNVTGPVTSVAGHVASFNNTTGTLIADTGIAAAALVITTDGRLSDARTPTAHGVSHAAAGSDPVTIAESQVTNLVADLAGKVSTTDPRLSDARTPTAHGGTHKAGGTDPVKLDELAAATDVTTLNVSTTAHGLAPKLSGTTTTFLRGDGNYATPTGIVPAVHAVSHKAGGGDPIKLDELAAPTDVATLNVSTTAHGLAPKLPGTTTTFLRGDGTYATPTGGMATQITSTATGVLNDWSPAGINAAGDFVILWAGTGDATVTGLSATAGIGGGTGQIVTIRNVGTKVMTFAHVSGGSVYYDRFSNFATSAGTSIAPGGYASFQYQNDGAAFVWNMVGHEQGAWITQPYSAADFSATAGVWTVEAGDVHMFRYRLSGRTLTIEWTLLTTSVSSAATALQMKVPGGFSANAIGLSGSGGASGAHFYKDNGGSWIFGETWINAVLTPTNIFVYTANFGNGPNWSVSTNLTNSYGTVITEVL